MLIKAENDTFIGGPLDVITILHHSTTGRYHAAFFEELPLPGPVPDIQDTTVVRLKSKMHRTTGAESMEEALIQLDELAAKISVPEENRWTDAMEWDGHQGIVVIVPNWRAAR